MVSVFKIKHVKLLHISVGGLARSKKYVLDFICIKIWKGGIKVESGSIG